MKPTMYIQLMATPTFITDYLSQCINIWQHQDTHFTTCHSSYKTICISSSGRTVNPVLAVHPWRWCRTILVADYCPSQQAAAHERCGGGGDTNWAFNATVIHESVYIDVYCTMNPRKACPAEGWTDGWLTVEGWSGTEERKGRNQLVADQVSFGAQQPRERCISMRKLSFPAARPRRCKSVQRTWFECKAHTSKY